MYIKIFDKEDEKLFYSLSKHKTVFTNDIKLSKKIGQRYHELIDSDLLEIARSDKKKRTWFIVPPDIQIVPRTKRTKNGFDLEFIRIL